MSMLDRLNSFMAKCEDVSSKLNEKAAELSKKAEDYAEEERVKDFYKIKSELVEINKKQKEAGIKETTIFDFFEKRPEYADLLELERNKQN